MHFFHGLPLCQNIVNGIYLYLPYINECENVNLKFFRLSFTLSATTTATTKTLWKNNMQLLIENCLKKLSPFTKSTDKNSTSDRKELKEELN
jgi:hypothetical protein